MADQGYGRQGGMQSGRSQNWQQGSAQGQGGRSSSSEEWKQGARGEWSGPERRVGISYNYTGPERRDSTTAQMPREKTEPYGQTGGMGSTPNTSERGHFGSGGMGGMTENDRGEGIGSERPYDEDVDDQ